jgi:hypothetical protein
MLIKFNDFTFHSFDSIVSGIKIISIRQRFHKYPVKASSEIQSVRTMITLHIINEMKRIETKLIPGNTLLIARKNPMQS